MGPHKTWILGVEESVAQEQLGLHKSTLGQAFKEHG